MNPHSPWRHMTSLKILVIKIVDIVDECNMYIHVWSIWQAKTTQKNYSNNSYIVDCWKNIIQTSIVLCHDIVSTFMTRDKSLTSRQKSSVLQDKTLNLIDEILVL